MGFKDWFRRHDEPPPQAPSAADFEPQNELEQLLVQAATDPSRRRPFTDRLLDSQLLVATPEPPEAPGERISEGETIKIVNVQAPDGSHVPAVFTSELRLARWFSEGTGWVGIEGRALFEIISAAGASINPGEAYGVVYSPEDLAQLLGKPERRVLTENTNVLLGSPAEVPNDLIAHLRPALAGDARITAAYLALAHWPDAADTSWYLEIGSDADADELAPAIGAAMENAPFGGKLLDVVVRPPMELSGTGIRLIPDAPS
jgi:hypothetical protein